MTKSIKRPKDIRKDEILMGYQYQLVQIESLQRELERLFEKTSSLTATLSDMPKGGDSLDMYDKVNEWLPLVDEIKAEIETSVMKRLEILAMLDTVTKPYLRTVLQLRYIEGLSFIDIAIKMDYTERWVMELMNRALRNVETVHINT